MDHAASASPRSVALAILRLARWTTPLWLLMVGLFSIASYLDADGGAGLGHIVQIYALGFLPWLVLAPLTVWLGRDQAHRGPGWPRLAAEGIALALLVTLAVLANMAIIVASYWGVGAAEIFASNSFREWIWDILIFIVALMAGHILGTRGRQSAAAAEENAARIVVRGALRVDIVEVAEIVAASAQGNYVALRTADGEYLHRATLAEMKAMLGDHGFVQVHRSHLVRAAAILSIDRGRTPYLVMPGDHKIPVSASGRGALDQLLETRPAAA